MSKIEVNTVDVQCGSTLTLGSSGKTVTLATGASQSGFGRTGTVDWQTGSIKTATFTAESGKGYFCNTAGGTFEVDLPAGSAGAIVSVQDYNNTFDSNALTVDPNGSEKINGGTAGDTVSLETEGQGVTFVYIDATVGWRSVQDNQFSQQGANAQYIAATGGTITNSPCGDFKVHTFNSSSTFTVTTLGNAAGSNTVEYLVVAGGGGGGADAGGGAGAGGTRYNFPSPTCAGFAVTAGPTAYPITVGGGGTGQNCGSGTGGTQGSTSTFSTISSAGGGYGSGSSGAAGGNGGSGGGGRKGPGAAAGSGNTPPVSPPQGQNGGAGGTPGHPKQFTSGGGGGACNAGMAGACGPGPTTQQFALGGDGKSFPAIAWGSSGDTQPGGQFFGGGGGSGQGGPSGSGNTPYDTPLGNGGKGGGGAGGDSPGPGSPDAQVHGRAGPANTGGGGGGAAEQCAPGGRDGGTGGSGIVIIRYKFQN